MCMCTFICMHDVQKRGMEIRDIEYNYVAVALLSFLHVVSFSYFYSSFLVIEIFSRR